MKNERAVPMKKQIPVWRDPSTLLLLFSNGVTIWFAIAESWEIGTILLIYWGQSAAIGFFHYLKIQGVKNYFASSASVDEKSSEAVLPGMAATFFSLHYSVFLAMFFVFIVIFFRPDWQAALPVMALFYFNHGFSYVFNRKTDIPHLAASLVQLLFFPYLRILPMHVIIAGSAIFARGGTAAVVVFLILKTFADLLMHVIEHVMSRSSFLGSHPSSSVQKP